MKSVNEQSKQQTVVTVNNKEKRVKKLIEPPKSPKLVKSKKSNSFIKKLKLKAKSSRLVNAYNSDTISNNSSSASSTNSTLVLSLPSTVNNNNSSSLSRTESETTSSSSSSSVVERQMPEGGDNSSMSGKSFSETKLTETTWNNSVVNKTIIDANSATSVVQQGQQVVQTENNQEILSPNFETVPGGAALVVIKSDRRNSFDENSKGMPAYGDLIIDPAAATSVANPNTPHRRDHLYKILVIGDLGSGKTSIIKRYVHRFFTQNYRATIGVDFALKVIKWDENTNIKLQLWDIAGQERYGNMTRVYYKEAVGAFVVFDVTRVSTFESVANWKSDLDSKVQLSDGSPIPCILLANKCDQPKEGIVNNSGKMDEYCKKQKFITWFDTSAKDNINIDEAAQVLVTQILQNDALLNNDINKDADQFSLVRDNEERANNKSCSC